MIILDEDEEQGELHNLVTFDVNIANNCEYRLYNHWPADQKWLRVDEQGLHASNIDREDESIAFMALSQIQVELVLYCDNDETLKTKREAITQSSQHNSRTDCLGPYDYGSKKWILTDSIPYNSRITFVNLIINDINDNPPIFINKDSEPIAVGYPVHQLLDIVMPRALIKLKVNRCINLFIF